MPITVQVLELLRENVELNGLGEVCGARQLDWTHPCTSLQEENLHSFQVVLAADVLYISDVVAPFICVLKAVLHPEG